MNNKPDHEVSMARADLYKIAEYAIKLHRMLEEISEEQGIEGWMQSKITKASDYVSSVYHTLSHDMKFGEGDDLQVEAYGRYDRRDAYQRDYDHSVAGMGKRQSRAYQDDGGANDERHDLDPTDWYFVKDGKMFAISVYPNQEREAIARGYSRTRSEAKAKASNEGVAENKKGVRAAKHTVKPRNFVAKNAVQSGAGAHKDKKKAAKQGDTKHKATAYENRLESALQSALMEKAPKGWEGTVKAMKKHDEIENPYALAHYMKNKGYKSHKKK
jgi:hypothetical protein